jgi:hypothetical protein
MAIERISPGLGNHSGIEDLEGSLKLLLENCEITGEGKIRARVYYDYVHVYPVGKDSRLTGVKDSLESQVRLREATPSKVIIGRFQPADHHNYVIHYNPIDDSDPEIFGRI